MVPFAVFKNGLKASQYWFWSQRCVTSVQIYIRHCFFLISTKFLTPWNTVIKKTYGYSMYKREYITSCCALIPVTNTSWAKSRAIARLAWMRIRVFLSNLKGGMDLLNICCCLFLTKQNQLVIPHLYASCDLHTSVSCFFANILQSGMVIYYFFETTRRIIFGYKKAETSIIPAYSKYQKSQR